MALYIKDDTVNKLAAEYQQATGAASKTEAVRKALEAGLVAIQKKKPLLGRMIELQKTADEIGAVDPAINQKSLSDEIWTRG